MIAHAGIVATPLAHKIMCFCNAIDISKTLHKLKPPYFALHVQDDES